MMGTFDLTPNSILFDILPLNKPMNFGEILDILTSTYYETYERYKDGYPNEAEQLIIFEDQIFPNLTTIANLFY